MTLPILRLTHQEPGAPEPTVIRIAELNERCRWRVATLQTKEPCTYEWLRRLRPDDTLFDIGANIGLYSLFAAAQGSRVIAFEPEAQNFAALNLNLSLNGFAAGRLTAYPIAASNRAALFPLYLSEVSAGGSCHSLAREVGPFLEERPAAFAQGTVAMPLGEMVLNGHLPSPTHVKIDVDGFEHEVLEGLSPILSRVHSLCIEINPAIQQHRQWVDGLVSTFGFVFDLEQVRAATRREGTFKGVAEHIFWRPE